MARRKRFERWIEGLELHLVEATENENGDGVIAGGAAGEQAAAGETPAIDPKNQYHICNPTLHRVPFLSIKLVLFSMMFPLTCFASTWNKTISILRET